MGLPDPKILIEDRGKPPNEDLEMDANGKDDTDNGNFTGGGGESDSDSDARRACLEDEDSMEFY